MPQRDRPALSRFRRHLRAALRALPEGDRDAREWREPLATMVEWVDEMIGPEAEATFDADAGMPEECLGLHAPGCRCGEPAASYGFDFSGHPGGGEDETLREMASRWEC